MKKGACPVCGKLLRLVRGRLPMHLPDPSLRMDGYCKGWGDPPVGEPKRSGMKEALSPTEIVGKMTDGWNDVTFAAHAPGYKRPFLYGVSVFWGKPHGATSAAAVMKELNRRCKNDYWFGDTARLEILEIHHLKGR